MTIRQDDKRSIKAAIKQARRDEKFITAALRAKLDVVMRGAFLDAQSKIHVDSGALLASGNHGSDVLDGGSTWVGWMVWGGHPGTEQAIYEEALGGQHSWLRDSYLYEEALELAIDEHVRTHLR